MAAAKPARKGPSFPVLFGLAMSLVLALLAWKDPGGALYELENKWGDQMFRIRGTTLGFPKLQIIAIDEMSISAIGDFPWKRGVHAQIVRKLTKLGVKTIAFDVLFLNPRLDDPKGDAELVKATREAHRVIHLVDIEPAPRPEMRASVSQPNVVGLAEAAALLAHPNVSDVLDRDGVLRRASLYAENIPNLGAALWLHYVDQKLERLDDFPDVIRLNLRGEVVLPTMEAKTSTAGAFHFVHAASLFPMGKDLHVDLKDMEHDALTEEERDAFKGGLALIGSTAVGAFDHYPSAFGSLTPGVVVHANIFDNMLRGDYLRSIPKWVTLVLLVALVWVAVGLIRFPTLAATSLTGLLLLILAAVDFALFKYRWRLDFVAPTTSFLATYVGLTVHKLFVEGQEKRWIKNTFGQYLSPKVVEALVADPKKLSLGGEKREMSVFFLDIAHFTNISEKLTPEELTQFLNEYLSALTDVILKYDGVVDKFIGDCIMAFWNAPVDQPRHKELACLAAVECLQTIERLNKEFIKPGFPEMPAIRIGLNAGHIVVGNMGSRSRFSYTVIGDEVNLASRLEGANKYFGTSVMASEAVVDAAALEKLEAREVGRVRVVGKAIPIRVFELLAMKGTLPEPRMKALALYHEGIVYYVQRKFDEAAQKFEAAAVLDPADKPTQMYLNMCRDYSLIPPPDDWDGVFNLTAK